jgi:tripartite-type tricarboxylate transporter receptor subunit TctC
MTLPNTIHRLAAATLLAACALAPAAAQTFPVKPVRAILPYSAGSGPDSVMRSVGEKISRDWGQQLVVDNKPGANGWLAIGETKRAQPDGYTLMTVDSTHMTLQQHLYKQMPFDPVKDFEPVAPLYKTNFFIVVGANAPWKNVTELLAAAKVKDGQLTYGSWGIGSVAHVGTAMFEHSTGAKMTHVPFKELPQLYTAVATGEVDWAFGSAATVGPLYKAKKVRLLAYAGPKRMAGYTDVPTVAESGGPAGFELSTWVAMFAPKGTPKPAIDRIQSGVAKALADADIRDRLANFGFEPWIAPPADVSKAIDADKLRFAEIVKRSKISLD